ncbi:hypothetical protein GW17_00004371 [Ensete ventricosum]|nr:hypothetical protein GW17_00004371 [Ensete ventricosum]
MVLTRTPFFLLMSSSSSLITSHGLALATAVAVSGAVILLAVCRPKHFSAALDRSSTPPWCHPRSCMSSSEGRKREKANGKQQRRKRVQFAAEVEELGGSSRNETPAELARSPRGERRGEARGMPANRVALYNGILRDRTPLATPGRRQREGRRVAGLRSRLRRRRPSRRPWPFVYASSSVIAATVTPPDTNDAPFCVRQLVRLSYASMPATSTGRRKVQVQIAWARPHLVACKCPPTSLPPSVSLPADGICIIQFNLWTIRRATLEGSREDDIPMRTK